MIKKIAPDFYAEKIENISPVFLKKLGIEWILVDIDNTLVPRNSFELPQSTLKWIKNIKQSGFNVVLVSNSLNSRAKHIADLLKIDDVLAPALKPFLFRVKQLLSEKGIAFESSIFIGDQVFTDVIMCKRLGLKVVLIKPISDSDLPHTKIFRNVEKLLIKKWLAGSSTIQLGDS